MSLRPNEAPPPRASGGHSLAAVLAAGEKHHASDPTDGFLFRSWRKKKPEKLLPLVLAFNEPVLIRGRAWLRDPLMNNYKQKVKILYINADKNISKRLLEGSIVIGRVIHTVFYAETLPSAVIETADQLGGEALTDLEKRSILLVVEDRLGTLYRDLNKKIEEFFPENKNYNRPEVKVLQDRVDAAAERRDFFEAIRLALTRVPDCHMEWPEEKPEPELPPAYEDYVRVTDLGEDGEEDDDGEDSPYYKPKPKPKPKFVPSFTKEWLQQAGQAVLLEAIRRKFATVESV